MSEDKKEDMEDEKEKETYFISSLPTCGTGSWNSLTNYLEENNIDKPLLKDNYNKYFGERSRKMHMCSLCNAIFTCKEYDECACKISDVDKFICHVCIEEDMSCDILERF